MRREIPLYMEDCDLVTVDNSGVAKYILGFWGLPQNCRQRIQGMVRLTLTLTLTLLIIGMGHGLWVMRRRHILWDCAYPEHDFQQCQYQSCYLFFELQWLSRKDLSWTPQGRSVCRNVENLYFYFHA